jgi:translation elongation factor P/translation initiation factor 5A
MATIQATKMRKGTLVKIGNDLFRVLELQHVTPGNLRGFVRVKFRNIRSGTLSDQKLRSEDFVERATLDEREMQYMYNDGDSYYFMDTSSYEQIHISSEALGDSVSYLIPEMTIDVEFYGTEPVGIAGDQGRHRQRAAQAGDARDGARRAGAAVHQHRRQDPGEHGVRRIHGARLKTRAHCRLWVDC